MHYSPRIAPGSWILVTGVNGLVASHTAVQALEAGYKVRGTVRDEAKAQWMKEYFDEEYGPRNFELVTVKDLAADGAFDDAVKRVAGVAHIASIVGSPDPNVMIPGVVNGAISILRSAMAEPSVKAVVYTSSSWAAASPAPNLKSHIDSDLWNEAAIKSAWDPPPYGVDRVMPVYAASKALAERECWKFMKEQKPNFSFNAVLPAANFGKVVNVEHQGYPSTIGWVIDLFQGQINIQPFVPPQYFVDSQDVARIHMAALIDPSVEHERIFAYKEPYTWNQVLGIFRRLFPNRHFVKDLDDQGTDLSTVSNERAEEILRRFGVQGFTDLEQSLKWTVEKFA